jgi:2-dehydro-3-deoxygluconokinase
MGAPELDVLALGEPMLEYNQTGALDASTGMPLYLQGFGGDVSNFAIAAARQGARAGLHTAVGDDEPGQQLRALWQREAVDTTGVRTDSGAATGIYFVHHNDSGHHFSFWRSGSAASRFGVADLDAALISSARCLHTSGISLAISASAREATFAAMRLARRHGAWVSFDTNLRRKLWPLEAAREHITQAMRLCDICLPSLEDMQALGDEHEPDAIVDLCLALGARVVAIKLGSAGALVADAQQRHRIAPFPCQPLDATGAGDTFGGAFVARLLAGDDLRAAGSYAAAAAALSTQGWGAVAPIPQASAVRDGLREAAREPESPTPP